MARARKAAAANDSQTAAVENEMRICAGEAQTIRLIFEHYLALGSVPALQRCGSAALSQGAAA